MKVSAFFYDNYTNESIWIAGILWPLYFIPFYMANNQSIPLCLINSLVLASFTCLIFADTVEEYVVFMLGVGLLVFGSIASCRPSPAILPSFFTGVVSCVVGALVLYLMRKKVYDRDSIPDAKGNRSTLWTPGSIVWHSITVAMFGYLVYYCVTSTTN